MRGGQYGSASSSDGRDNDNDLFRLEWLLDDIVVHDVVEL